ncbi:hypothetical protein JG688_00014635 [Phytophthora aleatoria]|uniref:Uncharacterized protein n=1 Tax=Phytophthora aleatoria TaxID=2496075 RepID=A0A8J5M0C8_9STRA|nr:hypothetical protein JG688_00014635 [Phytophthora aleatoria]
MPSPSDSEDGKGKKQKGYKTGSSGTPVNWNGDDGTFYKHAMLNAFEMTKIKILTQVSLLMKLAKQVMSKKTGTEMWQELCSIYEGKKEPGHGRAESVPPSGRTTSDSPAHKWRCESHLYTLFDIKDELEDLKAPVSNLQMVDLMLRSLPTVSLLQRTQEKGVI